MRLLQVLAIPLLILLTRPDNLIRLTILMVIQQHKSHVISFYFRREILVRM